jgi:LmbE family N-acetylglucosaminyl deacetylase
VFLTSGERGIAGASPQTAQVRREAEAREAGKVLMLNDMVFLRLPDLAVAERIESGAQELRRALTSQPPDFIYLPHPEDNHPDHQAALPLVRAALTGHRGEKLPELRLYEVWSPMTTYDWVEDITPFIGQKRRAIRCYQSQLQDFRYDRGILGLNSYRGCFAASCRYAEVFRYAAADGNDI